MAEMNDPFVLIIALVLLALVPFIGVMVTSFIKLAVVLFLVRNALGVQQSPPNMALNGLAIILTLYIMAPVGYASYDAVQTQGGMDLENAQMLTVAYEAGVEPLREFLIKNANTRERAFFLRTTKSLWPPELADRVSDRDLLVLIPAFTVSELTAAFEIGFLLYLPFVTIDLIVSNILLAMGMMMVSPMTISLPFKLLLFVLLDGWTRLIHGLVLSYQ